jgi:hypothetical protein
VIEAIYEAAKQGRPAPVGAMEKVNLQRA